MVEPELGPLATQQIPRLLSRPLRVPLDDNRAVSRVTDKLRHRRVESLPPLLGQRLTPRRIGDEQHVVRQPDTKWYAPAGLERSGAIPFHGDLVDIEVTGPLSARKSASALFACSVASRRLATVFCACSAISRVCL